MRNRVHIILLFVLATLLVAYVIGVGVWRGVQPDEQPCRVLEWRIEDQSERQYVHPSQLLRTLDRAHISPVGEPMSRVSCMAIEQCVNAHPMVRCSQCYKTPHGRVIVRVNQRVPVVKVVGQDGAYLVDSDRRRMPMVDSLADKVLVVTGAVSAKAAQKEYYDFALWLRGQDYWAERIVSMHVADAHHIELVQKEREGVILLGTLDRYASKLGRLEKLYTHSYSYPVPAYAQWDVRFEGQVVGRK